MESDQDYSLTNVVRHVKYFVEKLEPTQSLILEYKFAKPAEPVEGNKKFQRILQSSFEEIIVMNTDREMNRNNYVHLKSMTYLDEFNWFHDNLQTLQTMHETKVVIKKKVDLTVFSEKVSYDCSTGAWYCKNRRALFRPCYEAVRNGKLFRIGLIRQMDRNNNPNKKASEMIQKTKKRAIKEEKQQPYRGKYESNQKPEPKKEANQSKQGQKGMVYDPRENVESPFRFKIQQTCRLSKCCFLVMTTVYQVKDILLYEQMSLYVKAEMLMPITIANKCEQVFKNMQDELAYEVELRFEPDFVREMGELQDEEVEKIIKSGAEILLALAKDPVEFSAEEIVSHLNIIDGK